MTLERNRRIVLASRPVGAPTKANFRLETEKVPEPGEGQMLLRTMYLSLDPYMRGRMSDAPSYAPPVAVGGLMVGATVSRVEVSNLAGFAVGDYLLTFNGWQEFAISDGKGAIPLGPNPAHPSYSLGVLGMPGFTAYMGLLDIGQPKAGETVVVGAATGAVGAQVGQIAKIKGCRAIGVAGGADKCRYAVEELGFDACLDHRSPTLAEELAAACPAGVDVYFENVGGPTFDAAFPLLNAKARIPLCGLISSYNGDPAGQSRYATTTVMTTFLKKRIKVQGFIIFDDYGPRFGEFRAQMTEWLDAGKLKYREDLVYGLESAPEAFIGLLQGKNFGKMAVKVSEA
jgi:NADPH-dependent curcumin reductase CurA